MTTIASNPPQQPEILADDPNQTVYESVPIASDDDEPAAPVDDCADVLTDVSEPLSIVYETSLDAAALEHAERELGETPDRRSAALREIAVWMRDNPHLNARPEARSVLHFLRGSKFNVAKAKRKMEMFYRMRRERTEWFAGRDPFAPHLAELLAMGVFLPLRRKDALNRQVFVVRAAVHNPKVHAQNDVFKVGKMLLDLVLAADETVSVYGVVAVFDMTGVQFGHALALPPAKFKQTIESWECYACLNKKAEFVNAPFYVNAFLSTVLFFMSEKLKVRVTVNRGPCTLQSDLLPPELGGSGESYAELAAYWKQYVEERADWFVQDDRYKSEV